MLHQRRSFRLLLAAVATAMAALLAACGGTIQQGHIYQETLVAEVASVRSVVFDEAGNLVVVSEHTDAHDPVALTREIGTLLADAPASIEQVTMRTVHFDGSPIELTVWRRSDLEAYAAGTLSYDELSARAAVQEFSDPPFRPE